MITANQILMHPARRGRLVLPWRRHAMSFLIFAGIA
jgi:hypothetical protein